MITFRTILILLILIASISTFSQQGHHNPAFNRTWLSDEYWREIEEGKTPRETKQMKLLMQVYFFENSDSVLIGNFNEGMKLRFTPVSDDTLIIFNQFNKGKIEYKIWISNQENESILEVEYGIEKFLFKGLDKKYYSRDGVQFYINDKFVTGDYVDVNDSSKKISFNTDGSINGLDLYSTYDVPVWNFELPKDFDTILFRYKKERVSFTDVFHWRKSDSILTLYTLTGVDEDTRNGFRFYDSKINGKYIELLKIK